MPTYDYVCKKCHHQFEKFQSITAEPVKVCPVCGEEAVIRKITGGAGLSFKGSGFYITDYKGNGNGKKSDNQSAASSTATAAKKEDKK